MQLSVLSLWFSFDIECLFLEPPSGLPPAAGSSGGGEDSGRDVGVGVRLAGGAARAQFWRFVDRLRDDVQRTSRRWRRHAARAKVQKTT